MAVLSADSHHLVGCTLVEGGDLVTLRDGLELGSLLFLAVSLLRAERVFKMAEPRVQKGTHG